MIDTAEIYRSKEWHDIVGSIWVIAFIATSPHYPWTDSYYKSWADQLFKSERALEKKYGVHYYMRRTFGRTNYIGIVDENYNWIFRIPLMSR